MKNVILILITITLTCLISRPVLAKHLDPHTMKLGGCGNGPSESESIIVDYLPNVISGYEDKHVMNYIIFGVDYECEDFVANGTYTITLDIDRWDAGGNLMTSLPLQNLTVKIENGTVDVNDKDVFTLEGAYKMQITLTDISGGATQLPGRLYIQGEIHIERFYDFVPDAGTPIDFTLMSVTMDPCPDAESTSDWLINVTWPEVASAEDYDVEWTYINNYSGTPVGSVDDDMPVADLIVHFEENATRITTTETSCEIPLLFDRGFVLFRVRAVGRKLSNPSIPIFGPWTWNYDYDTPSNNTVDYFMNEGGPLIFVEAHQSNLNWQLTTTYAEEGKHKSVISYFDGSFRNRQTVTRLSTSGTAVVGETAYDFHGRPAIQVLPAPVMGDGCLVGIESSIHFYQNFNMVGSDGLHAKHFDFVNESVCQINAPQLSNSSGSSQYYSPNNPEEDLMPYVPDAELYPYSQVEYTPDNTGRIRRQSGVGPDFMLNSGHETSYYYGTPVQIQLDRLFGSEAGYASHYKKNMVIDPNGQVSVSYLDMADRVIATALAGPVPSNLTVLDEIDSEDYPLDDAETLTTSLIHGSGPDGGASDLNVIDGNSIVFDQVILVPAIGDYSFDYNLTIDPLTDPCLEDFCGHCVYDLSVSITDQCGEIVYPNGGSEIAPVVGVFTQEGENGPLVFSSSCETGNPYYYQTSFATPVLQLQPGEYHIHKELTVNQESVDFYVAEYLEQGLGSCVLDSAYFANEALSSVDTLDCYIEITCEDCLSQLGDRDYFIATESGDEQANAIKYDWLYEECMRLCTPNSACKSGYQSMLADVNRDGQYGQYGVAFLFEPSWFPLSVFNESNQLPKNLQTPGAHWRNPKIILNGFEYPWYVSADGSVSRIYLESPEVGVYIPEVVNTALVFEENGQYYTYPQNLLDEELFIEEYWEDSWVYSLVTYHPEWCYYESCREYNELQHPDDILTSDEFDALMLSCDSWDDAVLVNLLRDMDADTDIDIPTYWNTPSGSYPFDPFQYHGDDAGEPFTYNTDQFGQMLTDAFNAFETNISMCDIAAFSAFSNIDPANILFSNDITIAEGDFFSNYPSLGTELRDYFWLGLRSLYLGTKHDLQNQRDNMYAIWECAGFNGCFDGAEPIQYLSEFNAAATEPDADYPFQPCNPATSAYYSNKTPRFVSVSQGLQSLEDYPPLTQCDDEINLQNLLNAVISLGGLNQVGLSLDEIPAYASYFGLPVLDQGLGWPSALYWNASVVGTDLVIEFEDATSVVYFTITLAFGTTMDWNEITYISNLTGTGSNISMSAYTIAGGTPISIGGLSDVTYNLPMGAIELDFDCTPVSTEPDCDSNTLANAFVSLMNALIDLGGPSPSGLFYAGGTIDPEIYGEYLVPIIAAQFGDAWNEDELLWQVDSTGIGLSITGFGDVVGFCFTTGDYPDYFEINEVYSINCDYTPSGSVLQSISVSMAMPAIDADLLVNNPGCPHVIDPFCHCYDPVDMCCAGTGYQEFFMVKEYLLDLLNPTTGSLPIPLLQPASFIPALAAFVDPSFDYTASLTHTTFNGVPAELLSYTSDGCGLSIYMYEDLDAVDFQMDDINFTLSDFSVAGSPDAQDNFYSFSFTESIGLVDYNLFGTWCVPLKQCGEMPPCGTIVPVPQITFLPDDPCADQLISNALQNAQDAYEQYMDSLTTALEDAYMEHCLNNVIENLDMRFPDQEYHYTLYYYDQSGNLVRTVPPAGINMLPIGTDSDSDALEENIAEDRDTGQRRIFTFHSLATTYTYNSLNQLVGQAIPDHDRMDVKSFERPQNLDYQNMRAYEVQYVNPALAYIGGDARPGTYGRGELFSSTDAGYTWTRVDGLVAANLRKVEMINSLNGYALGEDGVFLRTLDGGQTWDMMVTYHRFGNNLPMHFNDMALNIIPGATVTSSTTGLLVGDNGLVMRFKPSPLSTDSMFHRYDALTLSYAFSGLSLPSFLDWEIKSVEFAQGNPSTQNRFIFWANIDGGPEGDGYSMPFSVLTSSVTMVPTLSGVSVENVIRASDLSATHFYAEGKAIAGTPDGKLFRCDQFAVTDNFSSPSNRWYQLPTDNTYSFEQIWFYDATYGLAILKDTDTGGSLPGLYATSDHGKTWEKLSPDGISIKDLHCYDRDPQCDGSTVFSGARLICVGSGGHVARITLVASGEGSFGYEPLEEGGGAVVGTNNLNTCWATLVKSCTSGSSYIIRIFTGGDGGHLFTTDVTGTDSWTQWQNISQGLTANITDMELHAPDPAPGDYFPQISGLLLDSNGSVTSLHASGTDPDCSTGGPDEGCNSNPDWCLTYCEGHYVLSTYTPGTTTYFTELARAEDSRYIYALAEPNGGTPYDMVRYDGDAAAPSFTDLTWPTIPESYTNDTYLDIDAVAFSGAMRINLVGLNGINYCLKDPLSTSTLTVIADDRYDVMPLPNNDLDYAYVSDQLNKPTAAACDDGTLIVRRRLNKTGDTSVLQKTWSIIKSVKFKGDLTSVDFADSTVVFCGTSTGDILKHTLDMIGGTYNYPSGAGTVPQVTFNNKFESDGPGINAIASYYSTTASVVWAVANDGVVWRSQSTLAPYYELQAPGGNQHYRSVCLIPTGTTAVICGDNARIETGTAGARVIIKNVFVPGIKDFYFNSATEGYVLANGYTIRHTTDGGAHWSIVMPSAPVTSLPVLTSVAMNSEDQTWVVGHGNSKPVLLEIENDQSTMLITGYPAGSLWQLNEVQFDAFDNLLAVGQDINGHPMVLKRAVGTGVLSYTSDATSSGHALHAFHIFTSNNTLAACGKAGYVNVFDGTGWLTPGTYSPTGVTVDLHDIFFHDDLVGYVTGDNGTLLRTNASGDLPEYDGSGLLSPLQQPSWDAMNLTDGVTDQSTNNQKHLYCIDFSTRWQGILGGSYGVTTAPRGYHRVFVDESDLFSTKFYYDRLGRISVSQNTKQFNASTVQVEKLYSYTVYDELGRITEAGQKQDNGVGVGTDNFFKGVFGLEVEGYYNPRVIDEAKLADWRNDGDGERTQVSHTYYDVETTFAGLPTSFEQKNLRKRVASVSYEDVRDGNSATFEHATHYTYDIHGNVNTLIQDFPDMNPVGGDQRYKRLDYKYDLVSGNVIQVSYQSAEADQWYHRYLYDADNRITDVYTSSVGWDDDPLGNLDMPAAVPLWHHDASYRYYLHGPLQRTEIGDLKVQGLDYAYTLQGWLKGVNGGQLNPEFDMGKDGEGTYAQGDFARDAFGFTLSYFEGDYSAIGASAVNFEIAMGGTLETWRNDLWNGNIGSMTTALPTATNQTQGMGYKYDQLNRIKEARAAISFASNTWGTETITDRYENIFTYDANGNILTQKRSDESGDMFDDLTYCYQVQEMQDNQWLLNRNRLYCVLDPNGIPMTGQIDDQGPFITDPGLINGSNNYVYDELGQLVADDQEEIEEIIWRVDGKISRVVRETISTKKSLEFVYDAMGNRIAKKVYSDNTFSSGSLELITYYLRDASGNVMSIYEEENGMINLSEQHIYGSSRLGMHTLRTNMLTAPVPVHTGVKEIIRGERRYELTNHLGNVLVVCSDQLTATDGDSNNFIDFYAAEVVSYNDFYPFGAEMTARSSTSDYHYNFQNQEKDDEFWGGAITFKYRVEDARLGRFFSVDPLLQDFAGLSPYHFTHNSPIGTLEIEGLEGISITDHGTYTTTVYLRVYYSPVPEGGPDETGLDGYQQQYSGFTCDEILQIQQGLEVELTNAEGLEDHRFCDPSDHPYKVQYVFDFVEVETLSEARKLMRENNEYDYSVQLRKQAVVVKDGGTRYEAGGSSRGNVQLTSALNPHAAMHEIFHIFINNGTNAPADVNHGLNENDPQDNWHNEGKYGGGIFDYRTKKHVNHDNVKYSIDHTINIQIHPTGPYTLEEQQVIDLLYGE